MAIVDGPVPHWERNWPGLYERELDALRDGGIDFEVDQQALRKGQLAINLKWRLADKTVPLRAVFPDAFPRFRPEVFLVVHPDEFPVRHCNPIEGNLCLLGRDSRQWNQSWTLATLLAEQLADALNGTEDEDQQGEPAEFWWNGATRPTSYFLIDSTWSLSGADGGTIKLRYNLVRSKPDLIIRGVVEEVRNSSGVVLGRLDIAPPEMTSTAIFPWAKLDAPLLPRTTPSQEGKSGVGQQIRELWAAKSNLKNKPVVRLGPTLQAHLFGLAFPMETGWKQTGIGWVFPLVTGKHGLSSPDQSTQLHFIRPLRAGTDDLASRNPDAWKLQTKRICLYGAGAIGAFVALELARNGCGFLRLVDQDLVEPGNSVRWPFGVPAWGEPKVDALAAHIRQHFPMVEVKTSQRNVGGIATGDAELINQDLENIDLVVDTAGSYGLSTFLADQCRDKGLPLVSAYASANVGSGVVAIFSPRGGCPVCLDRAWNNGAIPEPSGFDQESVLIQPPGCSERTSSGASYDLQEISLQVARVVAGYQATEDSSYVAGLNFRPSSAGFRSPTWHVHKFDAYGGCECRRR